jgi:hypothetical protein
VTLLEVGLDSLEKRPTSTFDSLAAEAVQDGHHETLVVMTSTVGERCLVFIV